MHTTRTKNGVVFIHNGDYSGVVDIRLGDKQIFLPFQDLKEIVADYVRMTRISEIEAADDDEILGLVRDCDDRTK